jgi:transposase InsO family protein
MNAKAQRDIRHKLRIFKHAEETGNIVKTCRYFGISRAIFYVWKDKQKALGDEGLINSKPCPINYRLRMKKEIEDQIIHLRKTYHFGPERIVLYLKRYHDITVSDAGVYRALKRNGLNRLPANTPRRSPGPSYKLYQKQVPGHHIQMDVKFLSFIEEGKKTRRFQYTAIDDATRIRVLKVYAAHNQATAIKFANHVIQQIPFRIKMIRTDNGHEFQSRFHWHLQDLGIEHVYIKKGTPRLNGKVERSHRTDAEEFYQLLEYKGDVDLNKKLAEWENFYNFSRPHSAHGGKTPYEILRDKLA